MTQFEPGKEWRQNEPAHQTNVEQYEKIKQDTAENDIKIAKIFAQGNDYIGGKQTGAQEYQPPQKIIEIVFPDKDVDLINQKFIIIGSVHISIQQVQGINENTFIII